jgi:DNA (cytosine-5)-methyltransferase 1
VRVGSLFAGIGGFDLASRWMGWETAWFSEVDPYASAVLAKHWPGVPNHGDITQIDFRAVEPVDLLCGGFPCQDISNAGKRAGITGERSGLWSEYARAIGELRPRYVVVENVAALLDGGLARVLGDLASLRYDAEWAVIPAADVGANHFRERVWIVAYPAGIALENPSLVALAGGPPQQPRGVHSLSRGPLDAWAADQPALVGVDDGVSAAVDRLRCLGNAIVPQCALVIFQAIQAREDAVRLSA